MQPNIEILYIESPDARRAGLYNVCIVHSQSYDSEDSFAKFDCTDAEITAAAQRLNARRFRQLAHDSMSVGGSAVRTQEWNEALGQWLPLVRPTTVEFDFFFRADGLGRAEEIRDHSTAGACVDQFCEYQKQIRRNHGEVI